MALSPEQTQQLSVQLQQILSGISTIAIGKRYLIPRASYITGPAIGTIPSDTKAFNITNLGMDGANKTFSDVEVTGIVGITKILSAIRVFGFTIENDNDVLRGIVTVKPAAGHIVLIQYMTGQDQKNS